MGDNKVRARPQTWTVSPDGNTNITVNVVMDTDEPRRKKGWRSHLPECSDWDMKLFKFLFVNFNIINSILGIAALAAGIFVLVDESQLLDVFSYIPGTDSSATLDEILTYRSYLENCAIILLSVGGVVFIIGFCGCVGALKESKCLLFIYATCVLLILLTEVAGAAIAWVYTDEVEARLQSFLNDTIAQKYEGAQWDGTSVTGESLEPYSAAWDIAMVGWECCGNNAYTDFELLPAAAWAGSYNVTVSGVATTVAAKVPLTCCKLVDPTVFPANLGSMEFVNITDCIMNAGSASTNQAGCYVSIRDWLLNYSYIGFGIGLGVALVELTGVIAACCLIRKVGKDEDDD